MRASDRLTIRYYPAVESLRDKDGAAPSPSRTPCHDYAVLGGLPSERHPGLIQRDSVPEVNAALQQDVDRLMYRKCTGGAACSITQGTRRVRCGCGLICQKWMAAEQSSRRLLAGIASTFVTVEPRALAIAPVPGICMN
jgi:hypothetical protein